MAGTVTAIGALVLAGWVFEIHPLKTLMPNFVAMQPWTAISIVLAGMALFSVTSETTTGRLASVCLASAFGIIAALGFVQHVTGSSLGTDLLLFPHAVLATPPVAHRAPGRIDLIPSLALMSLAVALVLAPRVQGRAARTMFSVLATIPLALGLLVLLSYAVHLEWLNILFLRRTALHTGAALVTLSIGTLALRRDAGWLAVATDHGRAGWIAAGLLGVAVLSLLLGADASMRLRQIAEASPEVTLRLEALLSTLKDAETGQRGYLLTGRESYLAPYEEARVRLPAANADARMAARDLDAVLDKWPRLDDLLAAKMSELAETIADYRAGNPSSATAVVMTDAGQATMDKIRALINAMEHSAAAQSERASSDTHIALALAIAGAVCLSGLAVWTVAGAARAHQMAIQAVAANDARQRDLLATLDLGAFLMRGTDLRIHYWSEGCARLYGWRADEVLGRNLHELLQTVFPIPAADIEAALARNGTWVGDLRQRTRDGQELVVTAHKAIRHYGNNRPSVVLEVITDVTGQRQAETALAQSQALLQTVIETTPGLIYAKDRQGRMLMANSATQALIGRPWQEIEGRTNEEFLDDPAQAEAVTENDRQVLERAQALEFEEIIYQRGQPPRTWLSTKSPMYGIDRQITGIIGVSVDITERKRIEEQLRQMINELNHRVKNTLATVQAIASQTLRGTDPAIFHSLEARLRALSAAHDVLTREAWEGADLLAVVEGVLKSCGGIGNPQFDIGGPPLRLQPQVVIALSMGLHELLSNALKYGALSDQNGRVFIRWRIVRDDERMLQFTWAERDGPRVVAPVTRGFGTKLVERSLAQDLGGTAAITFDPDGVVCTVEAPLHEVAASARVTTLPRVGRLT
ncbi:MAG: CHASE3 domain-containing protein [Acetobacteraceae bacterium]